MIIVTLILCLFSVIAGLAAFHSSGQTAELLKLVYAYLALTTVACALVALAARRPATKPAPVEPPGRAKLNAEN
jgi:predicted Co/Zn/Cd cation transporter (cation efflux family)